MSLRWRLWSINNNTFKNLQLTPIFNSDYITTQITQLKTVLQDIWTQKTNGAMIHSNATWYDVGEKPTKYFLSLGRCYS